MTGRAAALKHFKRADSHFYKATLPHHASLPTELFGRQTRAELFAALVRTVVSQQLGGAAAETIYKRLKALCKGSITPHALIGARPAALRAAGLSGSKAKTLKKTARAVKTGKLDLVSLKNIPEAEAAERLMAIWGLGPWSAEMFLMFSVGRPDIFSAGDLGLARAIEMLYKLPKNAPREKLLAISQKWSPYRTYACLLLWRLRDTKAG
ncbi:DNA-3-methyladenine glycosylase 2 family protein [Candidatus Kaiserbacteria bacterium]|nr:DNA-3-methyladenine glycosylase 2 family protein [Candidatus Kaiserbacteria bacterium]